MNLCLVKDDSYLSESWADKRRESILFICFDWLTKRTLIEKGFRAKIYDEIISWEEGDAADRFVFTLSRDWRYYNGEDFTRIGDIPLGSIQDWPFLSGSLTPVYKFLLSIGNWIECESPEEVAYDGRIPDVCAWSLRAVCSKKGIAVKQLGKTKTELRLDPLSGSLREQRRADISRKRRILARIYNAAVRLRGRGMDGDQNVLIAPYPPLTNLFLEWQRNGRGINFLTTALPTRPGKAFFLKRLPELVEPLRAPLTDADKHELVEMEKRWRKIRGTDGYANKFAFRGINPYPVFERELDHFFDKDAETILTEVRGYEQLLRKRGIKCLLLPFDVPATNSEMIAASKMLGIPTVIVLHGLPVLASYNNRDNLLSDYLCVWGPAQYERYLPEKGEERVVYLGNPYFDNYKKEVMRMQSKSDGNRRGDGRGGRRVLLLSNPKIVSFIAASEGDPEEYLVSLLRILSETDAEIIVKLHPSESIEHYKKVIGRRARLVRDRPVKRLISWADLVVGPFSTVLMEALISGKPVVCVNYSKVKYPEPFNGIEFPVATTEKEAKNLILEGLQRTDQSPGTSDEMVSKMLARHAGPLDDRSSERILLTISRIISSSLEKR